MGNYLSENNKNRLDLFFQDPRFFSLDQKKLYEKLKQNQENVTNEDITTYLNTFDIYKTKFSNLRELHEKYNGEIPKMPLKKNYQSFANSALEPYKK